MNKKKFLLLFKFILDVFTRFFFSLPPFSSIDMTRVETQQKKNLYKRQLKASHLPVLNKSIQTAQPLLDSEYFISICTCFNLNHFYFVLNRFVLKLKRCIALHQQHFIINKRIFILSNKSIQLKLALPYLHINKFLLNYEAT